MAAKKKAKAAKKVAKKAKQAPRAARQRQPPRQATLAELIRDRITARAHSLSKLTKHPTLLGTARETALAALLRAYVPRRFEVLAGTIARDGDITEAGQLDVMIVDTSEYPLMLREDDLAVALPQAVRAVIEVKSDLVRGDVFHDAIEQTGAAGVMMGGAGYAYTGLFCYGAPAKAKTLRTWLEDVMVARSNIIAAANDDNVARCLAGWSAASPGAPTQAEIDKTKAWARARASTLAHANLPAVIASDAGAVALKTRAPPFAYEFVKLPKGRTALTFLLTRVLEELGKQGLAQAGLPLLARLFGEETLDTDPLCAPLPIT